MTDRGEAHLLLALLLQAACAAPAVQAVRAERSPDYRIGPEDVLEIHVWKNDALSRRVPVRPDGKISLPLIRDVGAAGLTPNQLTTVIATKLADYIPNPEVAVIVQEVNAKVAVLGEVARPGRYELRSPTTALEILAQAGGLTAFAGSEILVLRAGDNGDAPARITVSVSDSVGNGEANLYLQAGDIVLVP